MVVLNAHLALVMEIKNVELLVFVELIEPRCSRHCLERFVDSKSSFEDLTPSSCQKMSSMAFVVETYSDGQHN